MYDIKPVTTLITNACGEASLKMLLKYYGIDASIEDLIKECGAGFIGCTAADMARVGKSHGLDMRVYKMDAEALMKLDRPAIAWWKFNHFVVFCGMDNNGEPVICNPSIGRFAISIDAFSRFFSGIALCNGQADDVFDTDDYFGENTVEPDFFND